jgi:hypothetical protein
MGLQKNHLMKRQKKHTKVSKVYPLCAESMQGKPSIWAKQWEGWITAETLGCVCWAPEFQFLPCNSHVLVYAQTPRDSTAFFNSVS